MEGLLYGLIIVLMVLLIGVVVLYVRAIMTGSDLKAQLAEISTKYMLVDKNIPVTVVAEEPAEVADSQLPADETAVPVVASDNAVEGFCPKLMQRAGFCDAGARENMNPLRGTFQDLRPTAVLPPVKTSWLQGFQVSPDRGTVWEHRMQASTLPL